MDNDTRSHSPQIQNIAVRSSNTRMEEKVSAMRKTSLKSHEVADSMLRYNLRPL